MAFTGNVKLVMSDAAEIARRLQAGQATMTALMKQYRCVYSTLLRAVLTKMTKAEYGRLTHERLARGGVATRFPKGHVPWTKGRKGISFPGSEKTQFKKGHLPAQHKHVGTIFIRNDKCGKQFRHIKISGIRQGRHKWVPYARYIWQQAHGPIPKGRFIVHVDGDTLNDNIDNLRLVNRREHLALQMQRDPNMLKKCRRNAGRASKKRHAANRKKKARILKQIIKPKRAAEVQEQKHRRSQAALEHLRSPISISWECTGCGYDFPGEPPLCCPKCNSLRFAKIEQRRRSIA